MPRIPELDDEAQPYGPDVSHHNRGIDWQLVAQGAAWATVKATEGAHFEDPRYVENVAGARKAGLPTYAYHYARADEDGAGPKDQAAHYMDVAGHVAADMAILDWEGPNLRLGPAEQATWILDWFMATGASDGLLYCSLTTAELVREHLTSIALWVAYWTGGEVEFNEPRPPLSVPDRVAALRPRWWQYTSRGSLAGIDGYADLSIDLGGT